MQIIIIILGSNNIRLIQSKFSCIKQKICFEVKDGLCRYDLVKSNEYFTRFNQISFDLNKYLNFFSEWILEIYDRHFTLSERDYDYWVIVWLFYSSIDDPEATHASRVSIAIRSIDRLYLIRDDVRYQICAILSRKI